MNSVLGFAYRGLSLLTANVSNISDHLVSTYQTYQDYILFISKRVLFVIAGVVCSIIITNVDLTKPMSINLVAKSPPSAVAQSEPKEPKSKIEPKTSPTQNIPEFATAPSWGQNFADVEYTELDSEYWNILVGPAQNSNREQQYYTSNSSNIRIENGSLRLIARMDPQPEGYSYSSARIETQGKQSFLYGRIDIVAKLPKGVGTWPAVWMLPANNVYADMSPESDYLRYKNGGEMDIIEAVGHHPDVNFGVAHTVSDLSKRGDGTGSYDIVNIPDSTVKFYKYTLLWTPSKLTFMVNDVPYHTYKRQPGADYTTWPFDQPFYLIANLALGGTWGGMDTLNFPGNGIDDSALPASLDIKSIYYYPYTGS